MRQLAFAALLLLSPSLLAAQQVPVARDSVEREVVAIRAVYQEVEAAIAKGSLTRHDSTFECPEDTATGAPPGEMSIATYTSADGVIRRLTVLDGGDSFGLTTDHYYDAGGRLRFTYARLNAVNGTHRERRVYWSASGDPLRTLNAKTTGPGYWMPETDPILEPREWIAGACKGS